MSYILIIIVACNVNMMPFTITLYIQVLLLLLTTCRPTAAKFDFFLAFFSLSTFEKHELDLENTQKKIKTRQTQPTIKHFYIANIKYNKKNTNKCNFVKQRKIINNSGS